MNNKYAIAGLKQFEKLSDKSKELIFQFIYENDLSGLMIFSIISNIACSDFDSPIEEIFAVALETEVAFMEFPYTELVDYEVHKKIAVEGSTYYTDFYLETINKYEVRTENDVRLIIECDGHDFHEKTKEQVAKGNERDLKLRMNGYDVIHFSGSQIYKDPKKCINSLLKYYKKLMGKIYTVEED